MQYVTDKVGKEITVLHTSQPLCCVELCSTYYVLNLGNYLAPTAEYYQIFPGQAEFASNNTFQSSPTSKWLPAQVELV